MKDITKRLIEVLQVQTCSGEDELMREYLEEQLINIPGVEFEDDGDNIYVTKGSAPYPCVVAHMDTVHDIVENLTAVVLNGNITGINALTMEQTGIGGDDKVGIFVALEMLRQHDNLKVFFARDEEIGCRGSALVIPEFFDDVTIALQCDRRGNTDFVTEACGIELSSKDFQDAVMPILRRYGYKFTKGMMTDVMELKCNGIPVSMANIACGYYNPHCPNEYVNIGDVMMTTRMVSEIISTLGGVYFRHEDAMFLRNNQDTFEWWNDDDYRSKSILNSTVYCRDCNQKPAGKDNLCDDCWNWYNDHFNTKPTPKQKTIKLK